MNMLLASEKKTVVQAVSNLCLYLVITFMYNGIQSVLSGVAVGCGWQALDDLYECKLFPYCGVCL